MPDGAKIINTLKSANYISSRKIFLLDSIDTETCAELIGNISNMVDELHWRPEAIGINLGPIPNPYSLPKNAPQVIDICIDSPGGQLSVNKSIMSLLNLARAKDAIIRTFITGNASSCASLIAVQGTPGFRIMYEQSYNLIHYGRSVYSVTKPIEIDKAAKYEKEMRDSFFCAIPAIHKYNQARIIKIPTYGIQPNFCVRLSGQKNVRLDSDQPRHIYKS